MGGFFGSLLAENGSDNNPVEECNQLKSVACKAMLGLPKIADHAETVLGS